MLACFLAHAFFIIWDGTRAPTSPADYLLILGNKVELDGNPSPRLAARLNEGLNLYRTGFGKKMIVSGGIGLEGYNEASVMKKYLIARGIAASDIVEDSLGVTTEASAKNYIQMGLKDHSVILVSQYYHLTRSKMLFGRNGAHSVQSASCNYVEWRDVYSIIREFLAFYWYLAFS